MNWVEIIEEQRKIKKTISLPFYMHCYYENMLPFNICIFISCNSCVHRECSHHICNTYMGDSCELIEFYEYGQDSSRQFTTWYKFLQVSRSHFQLQCLGIVIASYYWTWYNAWWLKWLWLKFNLYIYKAKN